MKILYIHGFGSKFDPTHEKIQMLETLGTVVGVNVDYCRGFKNVVDTVVEAAQLENVDLIVGTSMGGYTATHVGSIAGIPFVSINPAISPSISLEKWQGGFTDYTGRDHYLTESVIESYPDITTEGYGLVLLDSADEVISAFDTKSLLDDVFQVHMFEGGNHRFAHMESALEMIESFYTQAKSVYGNGSAAG